MFCSRRSLIALILLTFFVAACARPTSDVDGSLQPSTTQNAVVIELTATPLVAATTEALTGPRATAAALAASVTLSIPTPTALPEDQVASDDYEALLRQAWNIVNDNYVRDNFNGVDWPGMLDAYLPRVRVIDNQEDFWGLMEQFIRELGDDHSRFVRPDRLDLEFGIPSDREGRPWTGFTVWPTREDERMLIWYVCEFGPAAAAGLWRGDVIVAIDGEDVVKTDDGFDLTALTHATFGDGESDRVVLTVLRGSEQAQELTIRLGGASGCDTWRTEILNEEPRIGYIRVPNFDGNADTNIYDAIQAMEEQAPLDGLILDIRHNPGGNADRSIAIFTEGVFGKMGPLRSDATQTIYRIRGPVRWNETTPVVVLTDGNSHSAADYFAAAMKLAGRAASIGMPTAGNTEGISGFNLADGSLIRLAVTTLELLDGTTLEGVGVIPDIEVPLGDWGLRQDPDVQLQAALDFLLTR